MTTVPFPPESSDLTDLLHLRGALCQFLSLFRSCSLSWRQRGRGLLVSTTFYRSFFLPLALCASPQSLFGKIGKTVSAFFSNSRKLSIVHALNSLVAGLVGPHIAISRCLALHLLMLADDLRALRSSAQFLPRRSLRTFVIFAWRNYVTVTTSLLPSVRFVLSSRCGLSIDWRYALKLLLFAVVYDLTPSDKLSDRL